MFDPNLIQNDFLFEYGGSMNCPIIDGFLISFMVSGQTKSFFLLPQPHENYNPRFEKNSTKNAILKIGSQLLA